jgi:predicted nucleotidyltransferase
VPGAREQLVMTAVLDHAAGFEHEDLIGVDHGRQAMGDDRATCRDPRVGVLAEATLLNAHRPVVAVANGASDSTSPRLAWHDGAAMAVSVETTNAAGLEERERVLRVLRDREPALRARGVTRLALFGSTARGDMGPKSDVDLLIEIDPERRFGLFAFLDLKDDLAALLGRPVDLAFPDAMRPRLHAAVLEDALEVF